MVLSGCHAAMLSRISSLYGSLIALMRLSASSILTCRRQMRRRCTAIYSRSTGQEKGQSMRPHQPPPHPPVIQSAAKLCSDICHMLPGRSPDFPCARPKHIVSEQLAIHIKYSNSFIDACCKGKHSDKPVACHVTKKVQANGLHLPLQRKPVLSLHCIAPVLI